MHNVWAFQKVESCWWLCHPVPWFRYKIHRQSEVSWRDYRQVSKMWPYSRQCYQQVNIRLKFLYRNGSWLNTRSRLTLSSALIQCYFDYCCSSWYSSLGKSMKKKLQIMQNKVIRFIIDLGPRTRIIYDILESVNMLHTSDRVTQLRLNHVFNIFKPT